MTFNVVIIGGGPAGLAAALALGRARRRVLLVDGGARRNAAAERVHNFVTRDGTPPDEFRRIARQQLEPYASVEVRDARVEAIHGERGAFEVRLDTGSVSARRILLCTGMVDELPALEGFRSLWGQSIFQCPYCHGWEVRDQSFGVLVERVELLEFAVLLRSWTATVVVLTHGAFAVPDPVRARLGAAGVAIDERPIRRLVARGDRLESVEFDAGSPRRVDVLFARPPQRQVALVQALGVALDDGGYVRVDDMLETSLPGVYAGGDLITPMQGAILAAASGTRAAAALNHALTAELAASGALD
jgi:thioredoxin reductase